MIFNIKRKFTKVFFSVCIFISILSNIEGQVIAEEFFDEPTGATTGVMSDGSMWAAAPPGQCDGNPGVFAVQPAGFVIQDIEGFNCCDCGGGSGTGQCGDNQSVINFNDIDISAACMVDISVVWQSSGSMECDSPAGPSDVCIGGHDQMVAEYSIDGAPFVQFGYFCGNTVIQNPVTGFTLSGNSLDIRISGGNQASSEAYTVNSIVVSQMGGAVTGTLTGGGELCGTNCTTVSWELSGGTPPYDVGMNFTLGAIDFDFNIPSPSSTGEFLVCLDPNVPIPFFNPPNTVIVNELFGTMATIEMTDVTDDSNCTSDLMGQIIDIELVDEPTASMIDPIDSVCIETGGMATVDLSMYDDQIDLTGLYDVIWYSDPGLTNEIGPIFMTSTNTTVYAIVQRSEGCVSDDVQVQILLSLTPEIDPLPPQEACGSYTIPSITGTNLTSDAGIYSAPGGMGTVFNEGDIIDMNMILYIYDDNDGCTDEEMFTVTIYPEPDLDPLTPQIVCGYYVLPDLTGTNLSGLESYYELPGGMGGNFAEGDTIFQSIVLYAYDALGPCSDEEFLTILISQEPNINMPTSLAACGQVILPEIEGDNISSDAAYFTGPNGTGTQYNPGDIISTDQTLYIYDSIGDCDDEDTIEIEISAGPLLDPQDNIIACDYYVFTDIEGTDLNNPFYIDSATMTIYQVGDTIFNSATSHIFDSVVGNGNCFVSLEFLITIEEAISAGEDIQSNSCAGSQIPLVDLLDSNTPIGGQFIDMDATGALINDTLDLDLSGNQSFNIQYILENTCGPDTALITISVVDETDAGTNQMNSICEGSVIFLNDYIEGDPGGAFFVDGENTPVDPEILTDGMNGNSIEFIYIVGDGGNCPQDSALYTFMVIDQPQFFTPTAVEVCDFYQLPIVDGEGISGDEAYTTLPFNGGISYETGDTIFDDVQLYLSFDDGNCQSLDSFFVDIKQSSTELINPTLCPGDSLIVNGVVYNEAQASGEESLNNVEGCDSSITVALTFYTIDTNFIQENLCFGESIMINGEIYDEMNSSGIEVLENMAQTGCDSIIRIDLSFSDAAETPIDEMICSGDSILINNIYYSESNPSGMDTIQLQNGCDSILNITVQFLQQSSGTIDTVLCPNDNITVNGTIYNIDSPTGTEVLDNANENGCDSTITVSLQFHQIVDGMVSGTLCADESIDTLGVTIDINNPEEEVVLLGASAQNCDSTVFISFDFITVEEGLQEESVCEGGSIEIEGQTYDEQNPTGSYITTSVDGCDSTVNVIVTFTPIESDLEIVDANCSLDPTGYIVFNGFNVTSSLSFYELDNSGDMNSIIEGDTIFGISPGMHDIELTTNIGCSTSVSFEIMEAETPNISIPELVIINEGDSYQLDDPIDDTNTIVWTPDTDISCTDCGNPSFSPSSTTDYFVEITSPEGCIILDTIQIRVEESFNIYFPNTFTPNDDGLNDYFNIFSEQIGAFDLYIHDRWGNKVYEARGITSNSESAGWDGRFNGQQVQQGVYAYYGVYYKVISDTEVEAVPFKGNVTVTR